MDPRQKNQPKVKVATQTNAPVTLTPVSMILLAILILLVVLSFTSGM